MAATPQKGLNKRLNKLMAHDDGIVLIPFGFVINGTSDPTVVFGDVIRSVTRNAAGKFTITAKSRPARVFVGFAEISTTADSTDMTGKVDWSLLKSAGTFVVRTMTGSVQTDPTSGLLVGGVLVVSRTARDGRRG